MKTRLTFFAALAVLLAIVLIPADAAKALAIIKGPYLQKVTPNSIVIMWETDEEADSRVDYGLNDPPNEFEDDSEEVEIHEIELTDLNADTMYYYTVTSGTETSGTNTFYTAPDTERSFRFVVYGDNRNSSDNYEVHTDHEYVIDSILVSDPDIVLHVADFVYNGGNYNEWWPQFFGPAADLIKNTTLFPSLGNHEYNRDSTALKYRNFFSVPSLNEQWYAFTYGNVRFIALNTDSGQEAYYDDQSDQYDWLVNDEFESSEYENAIWHIVYFHHAPYTSGKHGDDNYVPKVRKHLVPLFEDNDVDIVFNGHDHIYEVSEVNDIYYVVTGGGGAPRGDINVNTNPYQIYAEGDPESILHHCVIDVDGTYGLLSLSARDNNGDEFHSIELECFPSDDPNYADWVAMGKPACWCYPYQCDGDAANDTEVFLQDYRVYGNDLELIVSNWKKKIDDPTLNPCADIDHKAEVIFQNYRVYGNDLSIIVANWKKTDEQLPGDCPRP